MWIALARCYSSEMQRQVDFTRSFKKCNALPGRVWMYQCESATYDPVEYVCAPHNSAKTWSNDVCICAITSWQHTFSIDRNVFMSVIN